MAFQKIKDYIISKFDLKKLEFKTPFFSATFEPKNIIIGSTRITEKGTSNLAKYENKLQSSGDSFTGRKKELNLLNSAIEKSDVLWLSGIMGIGKSTLALKIIEQNKINKGYTASICVDLKGTSESPLTLDEVRTRIINELQPQTFMPIDTSRLSDFYKNIISNKKVIIFLDNARDGEQVNELFYKQKQSQWLMVVTSRNKLEYDFDNVFKLEVNELDKVDAKMLLESLVSNIKERSEEIVGLCKHSPLAILWAGKFLNNKVKNLNRYVQELKVKIDGKECNSNEESGNIATEVLSVNYEYLSEDEKSAWLDLEIFDSTFNKEALSSIWRFGEHDNEYVDQLINHFLNLSLVECAKINERYFLHSAAKDFTKKEISPERHEENIVIYSTHFLLILKDLNEQYIKGGHSFKDSRTLFDLEWPNIDFAYKQAKIKADGGNDYFKNLIINYPIDGFDILSLRQELDNRIDMIRTGIKMANDLEMWNEKGVLEGIHGQALRHKGSKGDIEISIVLFENAIKTAERSKHDKWIGIHLNDKGNAHATLGDYEQAIKEYDKALKHFERINNDTGRSIVLNNLSRAYIDLGDTTQADKLCDAALKIVMKTDDRRRKAGVYSNKGLTNRHFGQTKRSVYYHEKALEIFRELGDQLWEGITLCLLGRAYMDQDKESIKKGIKRTMEAINIFESFGEKRWIGIAKGNLGTANIRLDKFDEAKIDIEAAIKIAEETGDERRRSIHFNCLGEIYLKFADFEEAIKCNMESLSIAKMIKDKRRQAGALLWLGISKFKNKEKLDALDYLKEAKKIAQDIGDKRKEAQVYFQLGLIEKDNKKQEDADRYLREALRISESIKAAFTEDIRRELERKNGVIP